MQTIQNSKGRVFSRTCAACGCDFIGRRNRKYCSSECKTSFNNERAAERKKAQNTPIHDHAMGYVRNWQILTKLLDYSRTQINVKSLIKMGFDFDAPSNFVMETEPGYILRRYWRILLTESLNEGICTLRTLFRSEVNKHYTIIT